jgi:hypothetical protein
LLGCSQDKSSTSTPTGESRVINFLDTKHGVKMVYPSDWTTPILPTPKGVILMLTKGSEALSLAAGEKRDGLTTADLAQQEQAAIEKYREQLEDFKVLEQNQTTLGGEPARATVYSGKKLFVTFQTLQIVTVHNSTPYVVLYMTRPDDFAKGRPEAQKIFDSFQFVN